VHVRFACVLCAGWLCALPFPRHSHSPAAVNFVTKISPSLNDADLGRVNLLYHEAPGGTDSTQSPRLGRVLRFVCVWARACSLCSYYTRILVCMVVLVRQFHTHSFPVQGGLDPSKPTWTS
jgi:hypothetical protein